MLLVFRLMILVLFLYVIVFFGAMIHTHYYPVSEHEMAIDSDGLYIDNKGFN